MGKFFLWILILFIIGYGIYFGVNWIKINLDYSGLESEAERLLSPSSGHTYEQVPDMLIKMAEERNIPLKPDSIKLYVDEWEDYRVLSFGYVDSFPIFNLKTLYFKFSFADTVFGK